MLGQIIAIIFIATIGDPAQIPDEDSPSRQQFRALVDEFEQGRRDFIAALRMANTEVEVEKAIAEKRPDEAKFIAKFFDIAERGPTSHIAAEAATWILTHQPFDPDPKAVEIIARHHVESDAIGPICLAIGFSTTRANGELLRKISHKNPHRSIRAAAFMGLAQHLIYNCNRPMSGDETADMPRAVAMQSEAEMLLKQAISNYGDVILNRVSIAEAAKSMLINIRRFGIGRPAAELSGFDADGQPLNLSDYRGKVVVLTFSGNWCSPCKAMYPDQRELVDRFKDRAFALLSVNTDEKVETLRKSIETKEITWRCWWDGGVNGPLCKAWDVQSYPTTYVLDPKGVIRYKDVQRDLKKSVELLMSECIAK